MAATLTPKAAVSLTATASSAAISKATLLAVIAELKKLHNKGHDLDSAIRIIQQTDLA